MNLRSSITIIFVSLSICSIVAKYQISAAAVAIESFANQAVPVDRSSYERRTTYDWGKHTGNDYDWGQHTGSTFDWGKYTSTTESSNNDNDDNNNNNNNNHENNNNNHTNEDDAHMWQHRCGGGRYTCAGAPGLCIDAAQICDRRIDCPAKEDEDPVMCADRYRERLIDLIKKKKQQQKKKRDDANRFRGQGFMFHVRKIRVANSRVKLFNQDSDRTMKRAEQN